MTKRIDGEKLYQEALRESLMDNPTGRLDAFRFAYGDRNWRLENSVDYSVLRDFDFATLERKVMSNMQLNAWLAGEAPKAKVKLGLEEGHLWAIVDGAIYHSHQPAIPELQARGYKVKVTHRRDYFNPLTRDYDRLTDRQAAHKTPTCAIFVYDTPAEDIIAMAAQQMTVTAIKAVLVTNLPDKENSKETFQTPYDTGGDTTVTVTAPSGHWATGVSVCDDGDTFSRRIGRNLALERALISLNEVVNGVS